MARAVRLKAWLAVVLLVAFLVPSVATAEIEIVLQNAFIDFYKNRATVTANYTVDKAHRRPNPPSKDGDIHIAGRATEIGLPTVAEVMNARLHGDAVQLANQLAGSDRSTAITGAWRLWTEHGGGGPQVQGAPLSAFNTTNPDHVFEIHPITKMGEVDLSSSLIPIEGFQPKDAHQAFQAYENIGCTIRTNATAKTTTLLTRMGGYNYVEFVIELNEDPVEIPDGMIVMSSVHDLQGELLVRNRRMVFIADTPPAQRIQTLRKGDRLHVLGLPRIDLALVAWRTARATERPEVLRWNLPYEIIVVGVYDDEAGRDEERE